MKRSGFAFRSTVLAAVLAGWAAAPASAIGGVGDDKDPVPPPGTSGGASGNMLTAEATATGIKVTKVTGGPSGKPAKGLTPVDPNWKPPVCWYEPVATPAQLKSGVDRLKKGGDLVRVTPTLSWGEDLMVSHYEKGEAQTDGEGYENFNLGKDGMFWRGVINEDRRNDLDLFD